MIVNPNQNTVVTAQTDNLGLPVPLTAAFVRSCTKLGGNVYRVQPGVVAKFGPKVSDTEAVALRLARDIGLPVPKVLRVDVEPETGHSLILMEYIEASRLDLVWDSLTPLEQSKILDGLNNLVGYMRSVQENFVGSVDRGLVRDAFFINPQHAGPYNTEDDFANDLARSVWARGYIGEKTDLVSELIRCIPRHGAPFPLTHGDLQPRNILVQGTQIVGILDWAQAGYYPKYWEFVKACFWDYDEADFHFNLRCVTKFLYPYPMELSLILHAYEVIW